MKKKELKIDELKTYSFTANEIAGCIFFQACLDEKAKRIKKEANEDSLYTEKRKFGNSE